MYTDQILLTHWTKERKPYILYNEGGQHDEV